MVTVCTQALSATTEPSTPELLPSVTMSRLPTSELGYRLGRYAESKRREEGANHEETELHR